MFGPDSVPPTSSERGQALNWDDNILPSEFLIDSCFRRVSSSFSLPRRCPQFAPVFPLSNFTESLPFFLTFTAVRKKQKAPNPLDKWEEMGPVQGSPLQVKSDRWTNGTELPRLVNGRPVQNGEGEEYGEVGDGSGNYNGKRGDEEEEAPPVSWTWPFDSLFRSLRTSILTISLLLLLLRLLEPSDTSAYYLAPFLVSSSRLRRR